MLSLEEVLSDFKMYAKYKDRENVAVNSRSENGETPLHWMATLGNHQAIKILMDSGAEINEQDVDGLTPMHAAVLSRQLTAVIELRILGADPSIKDNQGRSALDLAMTNGYIPVMKYLSNPD